MQQIKLVPSLRESANSDSLCLPVRRRNFLSGLVEITGDNQIPDTNVARQRWQANQPIFLPAVLTHEISQQFDNLRITRDLYQAVLNEQDIDEILSLPVYAQRLEPKFELLCSRFDASDDQEIVSVDFDVHDNGEIFEDIWMRISWLSFDEGDDSLRFRFSFGMEGYEDVSQDLRRQQLAAELEERLFPESAVLSANNSFLTRVGEIVESNNFDLLERIVYFNAPNGGAQFHHDAEKGHIGVVYAQLSGRTFWLALSKPQLIDEIGKFISNDAHRNQLHAAIKKQKLDLSFIDKFNDEQAIDKALNDLFHPELNLLLNFNQAFFQQLVNNGFAYYLVPGDVILLPQQSLSDCAWHSVFCVGEEAGQALSFAIKRFD